MRNRLLLLALSILLTISSLTGCNGTAKKPQTPQQNVPQTENLDVSASERRIMANQLSKVAEAVPDVQKASIVIADMGASDITKAGGNNLVAMAGITITAKVASDAAMVNAIKTNVANQIKSADNRIAQVLVTTDPTMIKRINDIAAGIIEGKPIQTFEKDINTLNNDLKKLKGSY